MRPEAGELCAESTTRPCCIPLISAFLYVQMYVHFLIKPFHVLFTCLVFGSCGVSLSGIADGALVPDPFIVFISNAIRTRPARLISQNSISVLHGAFGV